MRHLLIVILTAGTLAAAAQPTSRPAAEKVLVLPFVPLDPADHSPALGRGAQQTLVSDLSRSRAMQVVTSDATVSDSQAALSAARSADAAYVIYGTYQSSGTGEIRFTGIVAHVRTGEAVGGLKATGDLRDVFDLQDALSAQARRALLPTQPNAPETAAATGAPYDSDGPLRSEYVRQMDALADATDAALSRQNLRLSVDYLSPYDYYPYGYSYYPSYGYYYRPYAYWGFGWPYFLSVRTFHHDHFNHGNFPHGGGGHVGTMPHGGGGIHGSGATGRPGAGGHR